MHVRCWIRRRAECPIPANGCAVEAGSVRVGSRIFETCIGIRWHIGSPVAHRLPCGYSSQSGRIHLPRRLWLSCAGSNCRQDARTVPQVPSLPTARGRMTRRTRIQAPLSFGPAARLRRPRQGFGTVIAVRDAWAFQENRRLNRCKPVNVPFDRRLMVQFVGKTSLMSHLAGQILCFEISMVKINAPAQTVLGAGTGLS